MAQSINKSSNNILNNAYHTNKNFSTDTVSVTLNENNPENQTLAQEEYTIKLILPNFIKPIIKISKCSTFKDLSAIVKKSFNFESIQFRTWDHSVISFGNDLRSCMESGNLIFMRIDNFEWQLLNYDIISEKNSDVFNNGNFKGIFI
jgi:hypothetical protein